MKIMRWFAVLLATVFTAGLAPVVNAGGSATSVVIDLSSTEIALGDTIDVTVTIQETMAGTCSMNGTVTLYVDGVAVDTQITSDPGATNTAEAVFTLSAEFTSATGYEIYAEYDSQMAEGDCYGIGVQSATSIVTVSEAATTTTVETTTTTGEDTSTTSDSVENDTTPTSVAYNTLAKAGGATSSGYLMAALIALIAGVGTLLARRRA